MKRTVDRDFGKRTVLVLSELFLWNLSHGMLALDFLLVWVESVWESSEDCSCSWVMNSSLETREGCLSCCVLAVRCHCAWSFRAREGGERLLAAMIVLRLSGVPPFFGYSTPLIKISDVWVYFIINMNASHLLQFQKS